MLKQENKILNIYMDGSLVTAKDADGNLNKAMVQDGQFRI